MKLGYEVDSCKEDMNNAVPIDIDLFAEALEVFGLGVRAISLVAPVPKNDKLQWLEEIKKEAKSAYRKFIREQELHPDLGGNQEEFVAVTQAYKFIEGYQLWFMHKTPCQYCRGQGFVVNKVPLLEHQPQLCGIPNPVRG